MRYKDIWFRYYEEAINDGLDEEEATKYAEEQAQDYIEQKADYDYECWKESQYEQI